MMRCKLLFSICWIVASTSLGLSAQSSNGATSKLIQFAKNAALFGYNNPQEKVYLHFDNTGYFLGETIWFKAYIVEAIGHKPSPLSKTLYAELLTPDGAILQTKKFPIDNGICSGDFQLRDSLPGGFYEVRAYTRGMMNFGPEVAFSRVLPVFDQPSKEGDYTDRSITNRRFTVPYLREKSKANEKLNMAFFPEGGSLIVGVKSTVAFKVTGRNGENLSVSGTVFNSMGKELTKWTTVHDGMGAFSVTPDGKPMSVKVSYNSKEETVDLPATQTSGYVLTIDANAADSLALSIRNTQDLKKTDTLALVATCCGKLIDLKLIAPSDHGFSMTVKRNRLPAGVNQFTLYDATGRIRCERLIFNMPESTLNPTTTLAPLQALTNKATYKPYEPIVLELSADTALTKKGTSISVSVRDRKSSNFGNSDNTDIVTNLLLSSDLKGSIYNPAWYFQSNDAEHRLGMDLLMMTQGWRRYNWKQMSGVEPFTVKEPIEGGLLLDGEVHSIFLKKPMRDVKVNFWMKQGSQAQQGRAMTDSTGRFAFMISEKYGTWDLNIQTSVESSRKEFRILLDRAFSPQPKAYTAYDKEIWTNDTLQLPANAADSIAMLLGEVRYATEMTPTNPEGYKEYQLKEVVKIGDRKQKFLTVAARNATMSYDVENEVDKLQDIGQSEASSITEFLRDTNPYFIILTGDTPTYRYKSRPVVFKIFSNDAQSQMGATESRWDLAQMVPADVEKILILEDHETIRTFDPTIQNDPVVIVLITHDNGYPKEPIGVRRTLYDAYSVSNEFYSPIHQPGTPLMESDYRRTLYWNPDVNLDKQGKAKLEFYNNGTCRALSVNAEGITSNGTLLIK